MPAAYTVSYQNYKYGRILAGVPARTGLSAPIFLVYQKVFPLLSRAHCRVRQQLSSINSPPCPPESGESAFSTKTAKLKRGAAPVFAALSLLCVSCTLNLSGTVRANAEGGAAADLNVKAAIKKNTAFLLDALNEDGESSVIDAEYINQGLAASPGIALSALKNKPPQDIEGKINISHLETVLAAQKSAASGLDGIGYKKTADGGIFTVKLNRKNGAAILTNISRDFADYVSVFFAPIATGEELSKQAYLDLLRDVYGKPIADEVNASVITLSLDFPAAIKSAQGVRYSGSRARIELPLVDLLVLENEITYEITW